MKKNQYGFTLIEVLAVIVILGIVSALGISGVSRLIDKSRSDERRQQEKIIVMAAESYLGEHRSELPKNIGAISTISVEKLKSTNYLKEDVKTSSGESCMDKSYVLVTKKSESNYNYKAFLYCGDEVPPAESSLEIPGIELSFKDDAGNIYGSTINKNANNINFLITVTGSESAVITSYSYTISLKNIGSSSNHEVYYSGDINANNSTSVSVKKNITDYVDLSTGSEISIKVLAHNSKGGSSEKEESRVIS